MPSLITHHLFAAQAAEKLRLPVLRKHFTIFENGAQGPDFLFYHKVVPSRLRIGRSDLRKLGSMLHKENINAFYSSALHSVQKIEDPNMKDKAFAYVCGHLCHWALDSSAHPFVYSKVGEGNAQASFNHHALESAIDAYELNSRLQLNIEAFVPAVQCIDIQKDAILACSAIYVPAAARLYGMPISRKQIEESWKDFYADQKLFYDPTGKKAKRLRPIENMLHIKWAGSGFMIPADFAKDEDFCNESRLPWLDPALQSVRTESFDDLYQQGIDRACKAIELFLAAVEDPGQEDALLAFIDDRDYETGIRKS